MLRPTAKTSSTSRITTSAYADVVILLVDDVFAVGRSIDYRDRLQRVNRRFDDEGQEGQLRAVLRLELLLHAVAQTGDVGEVHFEESGHVRGGAAAREHVLR